jgi:Fe-S-cluster containining protein
LKKRVRPKEVESLGLENLVQSGKHYYLRNKTHPLFGPCVFLDEEERKCSIYSRRPLICRRYNCVGIPNINNMIEEARYSRKKRGFEV